MASKVSWNSFESGVAEQAVKVSSFSRLASIRYLLEYILGVAGRHLTTFEKRPILVEGARITNAMSE